MSHRKHKLRKLFNQQSGACYLCGGEMTLTLGQHNTAEVEHIVPKFHLKDIDVNDLSLDGFNVAAAGHLCNSIKSNKSLSEVINKLRTLKLCDTMGYDD